MRTAEIAEQFSIYCELHGVETGSEDEEVSF